MAKGGALSGSFWNQVSDDIYEGYKKLVELIKRDLLADGYPPFTQPTTPRDRLAQLQALKLSDSRYFWDNPTAQAELARLEARYGGAP